MNVSLTITFDRDEILAMCQEKCARVKTPVPGEFKVSDYYGSVRAEFIPAEAPLESDAGPLAVASSTGAGEEEVTS